MTRTKGQQEALDAYAEANNGFDWPSQPVCVWRPGSTAPKDGKPFLGYWGPKRMGIPGSVFDLVVWIDDQWCDSDDTGIGFMEPELWAPIPTLPSTERDDA